MIVLVTGGTGYLGSHACVALIEAGHEVVVMDNLCNSCVEVLDRIALITGVRPLFYQVDLLNELQVFKVFFGMSF